MPEAKRPTVDEVLAGALHTIENQLLPNLEDTWARAAASQLMGTLEYARALIAGEETIDARIDELEAAIAGLLRDHPGLEAALAGGGDESRAFATLDRASRLLRHAVADETAAGVAIRERLRPLVTRHADEELNETMPMLMRFGGTPRRVER